MKRRPPIHNLKPLTSNRKYLRKNLTPAEAYLWTQLKTLSDLNIKFRRQHSIKDYIVDFYCSKHKLIIEVDGNYHDEPEQMERDEIRDSRLASMGLTILRYENQYVFGELQHVMDDIKRYCEIKEDI